ncbi:NUDIX domain-containing protein [bacterium]|nr:NUDIX domain-containing protein [bacterium]
MEKHKAIAIPVSFINDRPYFLLVHDRRYKEWTFVTGGCRKREVYNPIRCAVRELEEETRGILNLKKGTYSYFKFQTLQREFDTAGDEFMAVYHVYIIYVPLSLEDQRNLVTRFEEEKRKMDLKQMCFRKQYDENDLMDFDTLDGIKRRKIWPMITSFVIENPDFHTALNSANRQTFSLKY